MLANSCLYIREHIINILDQYHGLQEIQEMKIFQNKIMAMLGKTSIALGHE